MVEKVRSGESRRAKGSLGKVTATLLTAAMIVGTGLFTSLGAATAKAGSGILIAMLIGGLIALSTGLSAAQVGINYPEEGGAFIWTRRFGYPTVSFMAGCSYLTEGILGLGILALGFATYTAGIFPGLPIRTVASVGLVMVAIINFFGISPTSKVLISIFFLNLVLLGIYIIPAIPKLHGAYFTPVTGTGLAGVLGGAATFFWTWDGFQRTAIMADEIKNPRKTIPVAIVGGISIAALIYLAIAATTLGILGPQAMGQNDTPLFQGATIAIAVWGGWIVLASACLTTFSEMLGDLLSTSKVTHAMGSKKDLPGWIGVVNKRFQSPYLALLSLTIIGILLISFFPLRKLMPVASAFTLFWYAATHFSALLLKKRQRFLPALISWIGLAACVGLFASLPFWSIALALGALGLLAGLHRLVHRGEQKTE